MTEPRTVAALYVERGGVYWNLPGVDPWDEQRDARLYDGPYPVVAHPPCARWSRLAGFTEARFGLKRGDDGGCFEAALHAVRTYGGVLEHPAHTDAFKHFGLPRPITRHGWTRSLLDDGAIWRVAPTKVRQFDAVGVEPRRLLYGEPVAALLDIAGGAGDPANQNEWGGLDAWRDNWQRPRKTHDDGIRRISGGSGFFREHRHDGMRSRTPTEFRDALLSMARTARPSEVAA